jgi:hypothetical protein
MRIGTDTNVALRASLAGGLTSARLFPLLDKLLAEGNELCIVPGKDALD